MFSRTLISFAFCLLWLGAYGASLADDVSEPQNTQCGGIFQSDSGSLTFPLQGQTVTPGEVCVWTIHLETTANFRLEFSRLGITANSSECDNAGVRLYSLSNLISAERDYYTFCDEAPATSAFFLGQSVATIVFYTSPDTTVNEGTGFTLLWEGSSFDPAAPVHHSGQLTTASGRIQYPVVGSLEDKLIATWLVNADTVYNSPIYVNISSVRLGSCANADPCLCDALIFYEVSQVGLLTEAERVCRNITGNYPLDRLSKNLVVGLFTDAPAVPTNTSTGINLIYFPDPEMGSTTTEYPFPISTRCGEEVLSAPEGSIAYKVRQYYSTYERCIWTIRLPPTANQITFDLVASNFTMGSDYDAVFVSAYSLSLLADGAEEVQEKYILNGENSTVTLKGNVAVVLFASDDYDTNYGFQLDWSSSFVNEGENITALSTDTILNGTVGGITYPDDGSNYNNLELTTFVIPYRRNRQDSENWLSVVIQAESDGLESNCYDNIKIYRFQYYTSGLDRYTKLCQSDLTSGSSVFEGDSLIVIVFVSDTSNSGSGFKIDWQWGERKLASGNSTKDLIEDRSQCASLSCN